MAPPLQETKEYGSISGMVRDLSEDKSFADEFEQRIRKRFLVKQMQALRAARGLSQKDIADKFVCSQSKISKLENGADADLKLEDLCRYAAIVGYQTHLVFHPAGQTITGAIAYHVGSLRRIVEGLISLAGDDTVIAKGVAKLLGGAIKGLTGLTGALKDTLEDLQSTPSNTLPPMCTVEIDDEESNLGFEECDRCKSEESQKSSKQNTRMLVAS